MDSYFKWLLDIVECPWEFSVLMEKLDSRDFVSRIKYDENRAADGLELRHRYLEQYGDIEHENAGEFYEEFMMRKCSVLEMMVALACRIEDDIMFDPEMGDRTSTWFWIMISNLGLDGMDNEHFDNENVDQVLNVFLGRTYFMNGTGGLFPLKRPKVNQRRVEIWYQMSEFLVENFG